ncbi:MAG TPA: hypothetical protein VGP97_06475 [Burkholderiales bacterium]|nr:hypothetical protein [Burkholderiales bacterium]
MGSVMGKVGRSYPRFERAAEPAAVGPAATGDDSDFQTRLGAIIGVACALGLIGWLMVLLAR